MVINILINIPLLENKKRNYLVSFFSCGLINLFNKFLCSLRYAPNTGLILFIISNIIVSGDVLSTLNALNNRSKCLSNKKCNTVLFLYLLYKSSNSVCLTILSIISSYKSNLNAVFCCSVNMFFNIIINSTQPC